MESKASRVQCQLSSTQGQVKRIFLDFLGAPQSLGSLDAFAVAGQSGSDCGPCS